LLQYTLHRGHATLSGCRVVAQALHQNLRAILHLRAQKNDDLRNLVGEPGGCDAMVHLFQRILPVFLRQRKQHLLFTLKVVVYGANRNIRFFGKPADIDCVHTFRAFNPACAGKQCLSQFRVFLSQLNPPLSLSERVHLYYSATKPIVNRYFFRNPATKKFQSMIRFFHEIASKGGLAEPETVA
jgi:hypothetical protein